MEGGRQAGAEDSSLGGGDRRTENPASCTLLLPTPSTDSA